MMRLALACFVCLSALILVPAAQSEDSAKKLKSPEAKKALADYEKAIKQAQETFEEDAKAARKKMFADLGAAQEKATKANDLDEAVLIRDIRKGHEDTVPAVSKGARVQVVSAFYGQNISWLDVTEKVRHATKGKDKWSATVGTRDWGDPAPGWDGTRTLIVQYVDRGKVRFKAIYEGKEITLP